MLSSSLALQRACLQPQFSHSPWPLSSLFLYLYPHPTLVSGVPASSSLPPAFLWRNSLFLCLNQLKSVSTLLNPTTTPQGQ